MRARDEGLTLIELVIASALGVVVLLLVGTFLISSISTQSTVTGTAGAASTAQLAADQLDSELRAASAMKVETSSTTASRLLLARTSRGTEPGFICQAWLYDAQRRAILHAEYVSASAAPWSNPASAWIDAGGRAGWSQLVEGVRPPNGAPVFEVNDLSAKIAFEQSAGDGRQPVFISTSSTGRQAPSNEGPQCF